MPETIASRRAAARHVGVDPTTVLRWITDGLLPPGPGWPAELVEQVHAEWKKTARPAKWECGTPAGYRAGCRCVPCTEAHSDESKSDRRRARELWWAERTSELCALLAAGSLTYREACDSVEASPQAVTAWKRLDPLFAERIDAALMAGRRPGDHGTTSEWRRGCRCPECREAHENSRSTDSTAA